MEGRALRAERVAVAMALLLAVLVAAAVVATVLVPADQRPRLAGRDLVAAEAGSADVVPADSEPRGDAVIAAPPNTFDAPAAAPTPPPPALSAPVASEAVGEGVWAVVIGIDDYPGGSADLRYARADAADVDQALGSFGVPADHRLVLTDLQVTADVVLRAADWLVANAGPDATAVFFYAGHIRKLGPGSEAIVAADGEVVTDEALAGRLAPLAARQTWIGLAGCFAGGFTELMTPGRVVTAAAGANQLAYENSQYGRSYLVEFMVRRAMLDERVSTVEEAFGRAVSEMGERLRRRRPVQYDGVDGVLSLGGAQAPAAGSAGPNTESSDPAPARRELASPTQSTTTTTTPPPDEDDEATDGRGCELRIFMVHCE